MAKALSMDLRERVVAAVLKEGMSVRRAAVWFGVSESSAIKRVGRARRQGRLCPGLAVVHAEGLSFKKSVLPAEQLRPAIAHRRAQWRKYQGRVDPARLVFVDETWAKTNMTPLKGWAPVGERLHAKVPYGHWRTMTFIAALRQDRIDAPFVFDQPINAQSFTA